MSKRYRSVVNSSITEIEDILDSIESKIEDAYDIAKSIPEDDVSDNANSKIGTIEEILDRLLYELK